MQKQMRKWQGRKKGKGPAEPASVVQGEEVSGWTWKQSEKGSCPKYFNPISAGQADNKRGFAV